MDFLVKLLKRPYPESSATLVFPVVSGLLVSLFLFVFRPFGLSAYQGDLFVVAVGYGLVTFICTGLLTVLHRLLSRFLPPWTLGAELLVITLNLLCIALGNAWFTSLVWDNPLTFGLLIYFIPITTAVGMIPILFFLFLREYRLRKIFQREAMDMDEKRTENDSKFQTSWALDALPQQHPLSEVLHFEAEGNFLLYFLRNSDRPHTISGWRFAEIANQLEAHPDFLQVHRSHLVRLTAIRTVKGNARGFDVLLENGQVVPVSRSRTDVFREVYKRRFGYLPLRDAL